MPTDAALRCPRCGDALPLVAPGTQRHRLAPLVTQCEKCLNRDYLANMRACEAERFDDLARLKLELAPDRSRRQHIVFLGDRTLAYCGIRPVQTASRRQRVLVGAIPSDACAACVAGWTETLRRFHKRKGGPV
jgi:hypothetical protein